MSWGKVAKMRRVRGIFLVACLLCQLARRFVYAQETSVNWEKDLGVDMCPECRPLPLLTHTETFETLHEDDLGADMCPEKRQPLSEGGNFPECRPLPLRTHTKTFETLQEDDLGADMCPEKRQPLSEGGNFPECRPLPLLTHTKTFETLQEDDLGADMCPEKRQPLSEGGNFPECRPLPLLTHTKKFETLHEDDLGADMCPEKRQPLSEGGNFPSPIFSTGSDTLVKDLQRLVRAQHLQIEQLGDNLRTLGKTLLRADLGISDLTEDETRMSKEPNPSISDQISGDDQQEHASSLQLTGSTNQENTFGTVINNEVGEIGVGPVDGGGQVRSSPGAMLVVPYRPSWSEHFSLLSAVKVHGEVSCINVLPEEGGDEDIRYVVGDTKGELYVFLWLGDLLFHYPTVLTAPITAMLSYTLQKAETILVTGHADGSVIVHQMLDSTQPGSGAQDGRAKVSSIKTLYSPKPPSPQYLRDNTGKRDVGIGGTQVSMDSREGRESVVNLEMFKVGKIRYIVAVDNSGKIQLFRDNGSLHGFAQAPSQPLAFMKNPNAQRLVFLTQYGAGTLDLRNMQVRSSFCVDLNSSKVTAYAFDAVGRSKANGFTSEGDLVSVVLKGEMLNFECHVKKKRQLDIAGPFAPLALKGYLVAVTPNRLLVFNTTPQTGFNYVNLWTESPRLVFSVPLKEIALSFVKTPIAESHRPVVTGNRGRIVILGFGGGYVGVFRSHLSVKPAEYSSKFSSSTILISGLVLLAMWQLLNRRRSAAAISPPVLASSTLGDQKGFNVRVGLEEREKVVEPRRFKSPTRGYVVANPTPFGSSSRKFMLAESDTYTSRREPLFASNQPVGELEPRQ